MIKYNNEKLTKDDQINYIKFLNNIENNDKIVIFVRMWNNIAQFKN